MKISKNDPGRHLVDEDTNVYGRKDGMVGENNTISKKTGHMWPIPLQVKNFTMLYKFIQ